jgi:hypothetical protein
VQSRLEKQLAEKWLLEKGSNGPKWTDNVQGRPFGPTRRENKVKKLVISSLIGAGLLASAAVSYADHEETANLDSLTNQITIPRLTVDRNPNQEVTDMVFTLDAASGASWNYPGLDGTPDLLNIPVLLSPAEQVAGTPPSTTGACRGHVRVQNTTRELEASVDCQNVTAIAAHLHFGAAGTNGGITFWMNTVNNSDGSTNIQLSKRDCVARSDPGSAQVEGSCLNGDSGGVTTFTESEYMDFLAGNMYFNVHTAAFPGGELRGQVFPARSIDIAVKCSQAETIISGVTPAASTNAAGDDYPTCLASFRLDLRSSALTVSLTTDTANTVNGVHVHEISDGHAPFTSTGAVIVGMSDGDSDGTFDATATLTASQVSSLLQARLYFNVHTEANPAGETRAAIFPDVDGE